MGPGTDLGSETGATAVLSIPEFRGCTKGKLVLGAAVGRVWVEALSGIRFVDESEIIAEDCAGSIGDSKFKVPVLMGGIKGGRCSANWEAGKLETPVGREGFMAGYCMDCCMDGSIDNPGGG